MIPTEPDGRFYLTMECGNCGESSLSLCMTTDFHDGLPVIPVDMGTQNSYACDCGAVTYTGDLETHVDTEDGRRGIRRGRCGVTIPVYRLPERAEQLADRVAGGVLPIDAALLEAWRIAVAEELRAQADYYRDQADRERKRSLRLADHAPKWQHEAAIVSFQELAAVAKRLRGRADYLHPEGADS